MNKDVIYVEPEDDITDIILKIENAKEKIVALVPPKKAGVFRSVVNIKLIAKSGASSGKKVVLVTVDPSILRLAGAAKLPVTKDLQTAPSIPETTEEVDSLSGEAADVKKENDEEEDDDDDEEETDEDVKDLIDDKDDEEDDKKDGDNKKDSDEKGDNDEEEEEDDNKDKKSDKNKKESTKKERGKFATWFREHKKLAICGGIGIILLVVFLVWAFVIAPAVTVTVGVKATSNGFSKNVNFTTTLSEENISEGKFYLDEKKIEDIKEVEFEATGKQNVGEKASGEVIAYYYFPIDGDGGEIPVNSGTIFTINGLSYVSSKSTSIRWDGDLDTMSKDCENYADKASLKNSGCMVSRRIEVTATESGSKYNIGAEKSGWTTVTAVGVYSDKAMAGGTDTEITVVQQADVNKAKESLIAADSNANKEKLLSDLGDDVLVIESSFSQTTGEAISTPGVGEEVKDGVKPKLKVVTTASIKTLDKTKVAEFITKNAELKDDQKIYEMKDPFIENFAQTDAGYTGKLKTTYLTGPMITVSSIVDMIKGKGIGDARHILKDIGDVADVNIQGSFPWVMSVPSDSNKITVEINVKDQNGADVKVNTGDEEKNSDDKNSGESENKESDKKTDEKSE